MQDKHKRKSAAVVLPVRMGDEGVALESSFRDGVKNEVLRSLCQLVNTSELALEVTITSLESCNAAVLFSVMIRLLMVQMSMHACGPFCGKTCSYTQVVIRTSMCLWFHHTLLHSACIIFVRLSWSLLSAALCCWPVLHCSGCHLHKVEHV